MHFRSLKIATCLLFIMMYNRKLPEDVHGVPATLFQIRMRAVSVGSTPDCVIALSIHALILTGKVCEIICGVTLTHVRTTTTMVISPQNLAIRIITGSHEEASRTANIVNGTAAITTIEITYVVLTGGRETMIIQEVTKQAEKTTGLRGDKN